MSQKTINFISKLSSHMRKCNIIPLPDDFIEILSKYINEIGEDKTIEYELRHSNIYREASILLILSKIYKIIEIENDNIKNNTFEEYDKVNNYYQITEYYTNLLEEYTNLDKYLSIQKKIFFSEDLISENIIDAEIRSKSSFLLLISI